MHGEDIERGSHESVAAFEIRKKQSWGLVQWITHAAKTYNADRILIEAKASGITVADEIKRLNKVASWDVELINPGAVDKVARTYAVQPVFTNGQVFAPDKSWADHLITQFEVFPKGKSDDGVDASTQALRWLRERRLLNRQEEIAQEINFEGQWKPKDKPVYDI
jgi:predicted phage terminase large subunit-like protein